MKNIFFRRDGQIAPFMIAIIVILIMAIMVTVNIGKIGLTKTHTANAADAGALAGSTMHANTLISLADANTLMIQEYLGTQVTFLIPDTICREWVKYVAYLAFVAAQTAQYTLAWQNAEKGYNEARNAAKQFAFMNAGIDEPKPRLEGETYEDYLQRESRFGQWMRDEGYKSGLYTWTDNQGKENSFSVDVDAPDFPGLIPMPMVLIGMSIDWIGACGKACSPCVAHTVKYAGCLAKAEANPTTYTMSYTPVSCNVLVWTFIAYPVPIAFIGGIVEDNPELTVTTTRTEPSEDLGLWQMQYGDITSQAKAKSSGGSIGPVPNRNYKSYLISGGY